MKLKSSNKTIDLTDSTNAEQLIKEFIEAINGSYQSYCILENLNGDYIQCAGDGINNTVEFRRISESGFKHFRLGTGKNNSPLKTVWDAINCGIGTIRIHSNEVLNVIQVQEIFVKFYVNNQIHEQFKTRNITKEFK